LALRKSDIEARISMWKQLNVDLVGLVAEPFAFLNAFSCLDYFGKLEGARNNALVVIDVGQVCTLLMIITSSGNWFRAIDWGLDDVTTSLAKGLKLGYADADSIRKFVVRKKHTHETVQLIDDACAVPRREIERSLRASRDQLDRFEVSEVLLTGGGAYQPLLSSLLNSELT
jgi:Tfp pilus assembly PilM family ATPase